MSVHQHEELDTIVQDLLTTGTLPGTWHRLSTVSRAYEKRGVLTGVEGKVLVDTITITIVIGFRASFPLSLPLIFLAPYDAVGFVPHVDEDGYICYVRGDGQFINYHDPAAIVRDALSRAIATITQGYLGENIVDFVDGFAEYWGRLQGTVVEMSLVTPGEVLRKIVQATAAPGKKDSTNYFADSEQAIRSLTFSLKKETFTTRSALYIPLEPTALLLPPRYGTMWSLKEIQNLVQTHTSAVTKAEIPKQANKWKTVESVVFGLPRPSGGWVKFGMRFTGVQGGHPLVAGSSVKKIIPISLQRLDQEYLMTRGGSDAGLRSKHVAVVGCGSVGATIAIELARSGVGRLTLIDDDILTPENTFRHPVGYYRIGSKKVSALVADMELRVPYVKVTALPVRIETLMRTKKLSWSKYDLIVVATGEPTVNLYINESLQGQKDNPPAVFAWLDPYGIGGHAMLQQVGQPGCLQCLYEFTEEGHLRNRASFAEPGQSFLKDIAGCGSLFTPFGALDVVHTAQLAVRMTITALSGKATNQIISWKGDATTFVSQGYRLAARYDHDEQMLEAQRTDFKRIDCSVCRGT